MHVSEHVPIVRNAPFIIYYLVQIRGALNAIRGLIPDTPEEKPKAVVTHSSGNHGQALTYAAKLEGT
jgi:hypothetical protein